MPTHAPNPELFPSHIEQHSVAFEPDDTTDLRVSFPGLELPASLASAVRKRQTEFLAGRWCAREALRALGHADAEQPIATGKDREPLWPAGIVGAITHTRGFASVAVGRSVDVRGIGLDAEQIVEDEQALRLSEQIAVKGELRSLQGTTGWAPGLVFTVVFSAKETIFKCLYPEVRRYFDFQDAVLSEIDPATGRFSARLLADLTPRLSAGYVLRGRFVRRASTLCTAMVIAP